MEKTDNISTIDYGRFERFLEDSCGILLGKGKQYLVTSRLAKLLRDENIASVADLFSSIERCLALR